MTEDKDEAPEGAFRCRISGEGYVIKAGTGEKVEFKFNNDPAEEKPDADA